MLELNKIYNEDCVEFMKKMPDESVDLIIADPPYYKTYGEFDFIFKDEEEYLNWTDQWVKECNRILKNTKTSIENAIMRTEDIRYLPSITRS